ncbi:FAD:protein FMN transferase [Lysinibacillus antri]|uniref:FAD:protein FMN transferase n=1 Tax=Lysinibacillus antri TaxID=2498145 RepID=A0A432L8E4_9BACI|nr:FAD:protein FMN transferase [Lysinibacillus antri]RUL49014.1 FAD:protein FMN transferase [Lysinibacillus antri]
MDTLSLHVMNTDYFIGVPKGTLRDWKNPIEKWLQYVAKEWSRFQAGNELDRLNQLKQGEIIKLSPILYDCIKKANDYYIQTQGLFSPYLKNQLEQHGYTESFPFSNSKKRQLLHTVNEQSPILLLNNEFILKTGEQQIDLGGFAKGYVVEKIAQWLQHETAAEYGIIDGGGDMQFWSKCEKEWTIGIAHPYKEQEEISYIKLKNGAIATSNRVYRSWKQGEETKHHLLNGQTGEVAKTDIVQATVVTNSLSDAEVIAKLCFLMREVELQCWLEKNGISCAQFIIEENDTKYWIKGGEKQYVH